MLEGKTFLITGATGRLGTAIAQRLEDLGANILPLAIGGYPDQPKRLDWLAKSHPIRIHNLDDLNKLPDPDYVLNCHWEVNRKLGFAEQLSYEINNNLHLLGFIWDWISKKAVQSIVNISSIKIFSPLNQNPISAETEPRPASPYGIAKVTAEKFIDAFFHRFHFPIAHLRLCSVMSVGEHPSQLISQLYSSAFENKKIIVNKGHTTNLVYIDEAIDLIINAAQKMLNGRYLITTPAIAIDQIAVMFEHISGRIIDGEYRDLEPGANDIYYVSDIDKFDENWIRHTSLDQAIKKFIELKNGTDFK
jgi:UDP-glucose 4-epimerase